MADVRATEAPDLTAYVINPAMSLPLVPAARSRDWMDATDRRFANRCLPLLIANQAGWFLISSHTLRATWNGRNGIGDLRVEYLKGGPPYPAFSHFGHGILTWNVPYLFRTPPGFNLLVRGPSNWPKEGATPLEGLVETDWSAATFTVNWRLTRPRQRVVFEAGEPICMLVPQRRGELEAFHPEIRLLDDDPDLALQYRSWSESRAEFNAALRVPGSDAEKQRWQKHYFQGMSQGSSDSGDATSGHQTKLNLREFADRRPAPPPAAAVPTPPQPAAAPAPPQPQPVPSRGRSAQRDPESILQGLIVAEDFIDAEACSRLVEIHRKFGVTGAQSDNGYELGRARAAAPEGFELARTLVHRIIALIEDHFGAEVQCDLALLCALTRGGFRHTLHADNALVVCPRHGGDAEELRRLGCRCADVEVRPNHTAWRRYSALLYLSGDHQGGDIVFGDGPNAFGGVYRREIRVRPGLLVLSPSDEHYFHHTTPVTAGIRYSMNTWYTDDAAHAAAEWR
jgi:hypothetical protein